MSNQAGLSPAAGQKRRYKGPLGSLRHYEKHTDSTMLYAVVMEPRVKLPALESIPPSQRRMCEILNRRWTVLYKQG